MAAADDLWAAVRDSYDEHSLMTLTNVRKREAKAIDDNRGIRAAQSVITYFPIVIQKDYDPDSDQHVEVGMVGVIAMLWRRGGSAAQAMRVKWEDWVELATTLRDVEPRGHAVPNTNAYPKNIGPEGSTPPGARASCEGWADCRNFRHLLPGPPGARRDPTEWM